MSLDVETLVRTCAVVAAAALLAQPYYGQIRWAVAQATEAARANAAALTRLAAAGLIVAAAWGKVPLPTLPQTVPAVIVEVEMPADDLKAIVAPVARELSRLGTGDRMLWAATWSKAAIVVAGDATAKAPAFTDTRSLQAFTALALDIAWRRLGNHAPGNEPLRRALEAAYGQAVGTDEVPVTRDVRDRYEAFAKAVAWAGLNGG